MSIIRKMRKQEALYWKKNTTPDRFGKYTFQDPVEITCRWDDKQEERKDSKGQLGLCNSVVYVDREMFVGDRLLSGTFTTGSILVAGAGDAAANGTYELFEAGVYKNPTSEYRIVFSESSNVWQILHPFDTIVYQSTTTSLTGAWELAEEEPNNEPAPTSVTWTGGNLSSAKEITSFDKIPNLKATEFLYIAYL